MTPTNRREIRPSNWLAISTLWRREMVRFVRQRSRIIGALGTPLVFWVLIGAGLGRSFHLPDNGASISYFEFSFPGAIASILMFTAIFSTISIIDDRREGFLQSVLVSPASPASIVLGKVLGGVTLAVAQACLFMALAPTAGLKLSFASLFACLGAMILLATAMTALGFWIAWSMESTQGFHAIMNLVLMPLLVLSGAFFPPSGSSRWLAMVIGANPVTYGVNLLRYAIYAGGVPPAFRSASLAVSLSVTLGFAIIMLGLCIRTVVRGSKRAIQ
jgi:ABC-2 type transport system permease protein